LHLSFLHFIIFFFSRFWFDSSWITSWQWLHNLKQSRVLHILFSKIWRLPTLKLVWEEKKKSSPRVFYISISKVFFSALFFMIRFHVLYQEPWICFCTRLSSLTGSFSLTLFSHETLSFLLFTRRAGKLRMRAPRPRAYIHVRDRFLRGR
jgi:hypothetical protein